MTYYGENLRSQIDFQTGQPLIFGVPKQSPYIFSETRRGLQNGFRVSGDGLNDARFPFTSTDAVDLDENSRKAIPRDIYFVKAPYTKKVPQSKTFLTDYVHYNLPYQINNDGSPRYDVTPSKNEERQKTLGQLERLKSFLGQGQDQTIQKLYDEALSNLLITDPELYRTLKTDQNNNELSNLRAEMKQMNENMILNEMNKEDVNQFILDAENFVEKYMVEEKSEDTLFKFEKLGDMMDNLLKRPNLTSKQRRDIMSFQAKFTQLVGQEYFKEKIAEGSELHKAIVEKRYSELEDISKLRTAEKIIEEHEKLIALMKSGELPEEVKILKEEHLKELKALEGISLGEDKKTLKDMIADMEGKIKFVKPPEFVKSPSSGITGNIIKSEILMKKSPEEIKDYVENVYNDAGFEIPDEVVEIIEKATPENIEKVADEIVKDIETEFTKPKSSKKPSKKIPEGLSDIEKFRFNALKAVDKSKKEGLMNIDGKATQFKNFMKDLRQVEMKEDKDIVDIFTSAFLSRKDPMSDEGKRESDANKLIILTNLYEMYPEKEILKNLIDIIGSTGSSPIGSPRGVKPKKKKVKRRKN